MPKYPELRHGIVIAQIRLRAHWRLSRLLKPWLTPSNRRRDGAFRFGRRFIASGEAGHDFAPFASFMMTGSEVAHQPAISS
jgi:hypothetical protein